MNKMNYFSISPKESRITKNPLITPISCGLVGTILKQDAVPCAYEFDFDAEKAEVRKRWPDDTPERSVNRVIAAKYTDLFNTQLKEAGQNAIYWDVVESFSKLKDYFNNWKKVNSEKDSRISESELPFFILTKMPNDLRQVLFNYVSPISGKKLSEFFDGYIGNGDIWRANTIKKVMGNMREVGRPFVSISNKDTELVNLIDELNVPHGIVSCYDTTRGIEEDPDVSPLTIKAEKLKKNGTIVQANTPEDVSRILFEMLFLRG